MNSRLHIRGPESFDFGYTVIEPGDTEGAVTGIEFGIRRLRAGESVSDIDDSCETVLTMLGGEGDVSAGGIELSFARTNIFRDHPFGARMPQGCDYQIHAATETEIAVAKARTTYEKDVAVIGPDGFAPGKNLTEPGEGVMGDVFHRTVRTMFTDGTLAVGETVGRGWSSYPPHHHPQPEVYFYRFDPAQGYGFAGVGEPAARVRNNDLTIMLDGQDHSQSCAPGYTEYYLWVILNLLDNPYTDPQNTPDHEWVLA